MTLPLTPETLAGAYDYLRTTPPFKRWNLPESEDVRFLVSKLRRDFAQYHWDGEQHTISMSGAAIGQTYTLMEKMSHEMIHMHLEATGMESRGWDKDSHNKAFRKFAGDVCRFHGFDPKAFY
jgi:hypothetical protein